MSHVGRHIGRYRILEQLGSGGMSVVYKGLDTALDREVAVKVLHPHLAGKEESRKRLAREAKAVAKLHHPNILEVFDFAGAEAEEAYIVTEYIRGQTLRQYATGQLFEPPEVAAMVVHEIAAALAHAHEAGIIHRDLKPENVMVREDGLLKLMDFGIAKIIDRDDRMTMTGALVGSPAHMAPEIIEGEEAGAESDVFSLGTMLYSFATGRLPFTGANTTATLKKILDGVYDDPRQIAPTVSDELAEIIATCLARQPAARYPHAGKLREALGEYLSSLGFSRVTEELGSFFADPSSYRKLLSKRLVEALVKRGEQLIADKRPAKALSTLNHVLALDGDNARALELLKQMNISRQRQRRKIASVWMGAAILAAAALVAGSAQAYRIWTRPKDFLPGGTRGTDVVVAASAFPVPQPSTPKEVVKAPEVPVETPAVPIKTAPLVGRKRPVDEGVRVAKADPPKTAGTVPVHLKVKPFGAVKVDTDPPDARESQDHELNLTPGKHQVTVSCGGCEDFVQTVIVPPEGGDVHVVAKPKPAKLEFKFDPADATVRVGNEGRAASTTHENPFVIRGAPGDPIGYSDVVYEVVKPGFKALRGKVDKLRPDQVFTVAGSLEPE